MVMLKFPVKPVLSTTVRPRISESDWANTPSDMLVALTSLGLLFILPHEGANGFPASGRAGACDGSGAAQSASVDCTSPTPSLPSFLATRSEEHTSELQSQFH